MNTEPELARPNDVQLSNAMLQYISLIASTHPGSAGSEQYFKFTIGAVEYSGSFNIRWNKIRSLEARKNNDD